MSRLERALLAFMLASGAAFWIRLTLDLTPPTAGTPATFIPVTGPQGTGHFKETTAP